jgi:uncharacterized membrane protein
MTNNSFFSRFLFLDLFFFSQTVNIYLMKLIPRKTFFNKEEETQIIQAIQEAEKNTSGEIKIHIESRAKKDVFERALEVFGELQLHKTQLRNGILFYLAVKDHHFAIVGDEGINQVVPENFWDSVKNEMSQAFQQKSFATGLTKAILMAGEQLKAHFPYQKEDINEISDDISMGE